MEKADLEIVKLVEDSYGDRVVDLGELVSYNIKLRKWCAKITGFEIKVVGKSEPEKRVYFRREFLPKSRLPKGGIGIDISSLKKGDIIEAHGESWKHSVDNYFRVIEIREDEVELERLGNDRDLSKVLRQLKASK